MFDSPDDATVPPNGARSVSMYYPEGENSIPPSTSSQSLSSDPSVANLIDIETPSINLIEPNVSTTDGGSLNEESFTNSERLLQSTQSSQNNSRSASPQNVPLQNGNSEYYNGRNSIMSSGTASSPSSSNVFINGGRSDMNDAISKKNSSRKTSKASIVEISESDMSYDQVLIMQVNSNNGEENTGPPGMMSEEKLLAAVEVGFRITY